jgi:hypothetical protein
VNVGGVTLEQSQSELTLKRLNPAGNVPIILIGATLESNAASPTFLTSTNIVVAVPGATVVFATASIFHTGLGVAAIATGVIQPTTTRTANVARAARIVMLPKRLI